jgi:hypothetical protein
MVSLYWGRLFGIRDFKVWKNERRLNKFLDAVAKQNEKTREYAEEEIAYCWCDVYHESTGKHLSTRALNFTQLPIIDTKRIIKISQVSCKPLEFMPRELYKY